MKKLFLITVTVFAFCACGSKPDPMTSFNFQDDIAPCVNIAFANTATLAKTDEIDDGNIYIFNMPANPELTHTLEKYYNKNSELSFVPANARFAPMETIYEILPSDMYPTRTAAVVFMRGEEGMYLASLVGEGDRKEAFLFSVKVLVRRNDFLQSFSALQWIGTPAGKRFIENMVDQAHWYYNNINRCELASEKQMMKELDKEVDKIEEAPSILSDTKN